MEKSYRSIIKAISYRITGTITTSIITYIITKKIEFALSIGLFDVISKIIIFYFHERIWNKIHLGRIKKKDIEYHI